MHGLVSSWPRGTAGAAASGGGAGPASIFATCCIMTVLSPSNVVSTLVSAAIGPILFCDRNPCMRGRCQ